MIEPHAVRVRQAGELPNLSIVEFILYHMNDTKY